VDLVDPKE